MGSQRVGHGLLTKWGFPHSSVDKESACNAGDPGSIPGSRRSAGEGIGYPLQHSWASLVAQLVNNPPALWDTWVEKIPWIRERLPVPIFWPGEFHGLYSPWYSPWGHKEQDTIKQLSLSDWTTTTNYDRCEGIAHCDFDLLFPNG